MSWFWTDSTGITREVADVPRGRHLRPRRTLWDRLKAVYLRWLNDERADR